MQVCCKVTIKLCGGNYNVDGITENIKLHNYATSNPKRGQRTIVSNIG